jgi:Ca2+-binding RTX toxin-like protein
VLGRRATTLIGAAALLALPGAARAATVGVQQAGSGERALVYSGDPGEDNQVNVSFDRETQLFHVVDSGALLLTPGPRCVGDGLDGIACDASGVTTMRLDGGDGNDTIEDDVRPIPVSAIRLVEIDGGEGDDHLQGSKVDEGFDGGPGADYVSGGGGTDSAKENGVDANGNGVTVTLDAKPNDGVPGEGDDIRGVETVVGGPAADTLVGSNRRQRLYGAGGDDRIYGRGGNDYLVGGGGVDVLEGGTGRDRLNGRDHGAPAADSLDCGNGWDEAIGDAADAFGSNCEQYVFGGASHFHRATKASGRPPGLPAIVAPTAILHSQFLVLIAGCRESAACSASVRITALVSSNGGTGAQRRTLARGRFHARAGQIKLVRLQLSRRARRLVRRVHRSTVYVRAVGAHGGVAVTKRRVQLR